MDPYLWLRVSAIIVGVAYSSWTMALRSAVTLQQGSVSPPLASLAAAARSAMVPVLGSCFIVWLLLIG